MFLCSLILISFGPILNNLIGTGKLIDIPHFDTLTNSFGILLFAYILIKFPDLFTIFPFIVIRLTVLDMKTGIPVFDYEWESETKSQSLEKSLYSGVLQGRRYRLYEIRICKKTTGASLACRRNPIVDSGYNRIPAHCNE